MDTSANIRIDQFLDEVPNLLTKALDAEHKEYEYLIYNLEPEHLDGHHFEEMVRFRDGPAVPALGKKENQELVARALRRPDYPSAEMLLDLRKVEGLTLPQATVLLHFHHPAYPIYSEKVVAALNHMGFPVVFQTDINEDNVQCYEGYIAAIDRLKAKIPFTRLPEVNVFLTRVIESCLYVS